MKGPTAYISYIITGVWVVSFLVDIINPEYDAPASVHPLMMLVAGALFGEGLLRRHNGKDNTDKEVEGV